MLIPGPRNLNPEPAVAWPRGPGPEFEYEPDVMLVKKSSLSCRSSPFPAKRPQWPGTVSQGSASNTCIAAAALLLSWPHWQGSSLLRSLEFLNWQGISSDSQYLGSSHVPAQLLQQNTAQNSTAHRSATIKAPCSHLDRDRGRDRHGPG